MKLLRFSVLFLLVPFILPTALSLLAQHQHGPANPKKGPDFSIRSVKSGPWSDAGTWQPKRVPQQGDRVLIGKGTRVVYDVDSDSVIRLVQVAGTLTFSRERNTTLNVGLLSVQNSEVCNENGFACSFHPDGPAKGTRGRLEIGTPDEPIPANVSARVRLHYQEGMDKEDAPAIVCCSGHMDIHGAPMSRTWLPLGQTAKPGDTSVTLAEPVTGWRAGDEIIVTGAKPLGYNKRRVSEERRITKIDGTALHLDKALEREHFGTGKFRSEVANLSHNVIIESADPKGMRGHTVYHRYSSGSISYARFAHLGKKGILGRYPIHYHLVGDTMRGSYVQGVSVVDSHNRWVTIHGTQFLLVRDCVGYQSIGHGYFLEDGTEVYNILDRNLGVQAVRGKPLPKQMLPFDPNDGAAFWWPNGRNTLVRNVSCENDEYGYRYDSQKSKYFDTTLPILMPDGNTKLVDIRTLAFLRFEDNTAHTEGLYGLLLANNGNSQPDDSITTQKQLEYFRKIDWTGPDAKHPHIIKNFTAWYTHYALRPHTPNTWMENILLYHPVYGIYRPHFDNHVYKNIHMIDASSEPFNRGMDDASAQGGTFTVDGLTFENPGYPGIPLVQMSDNNLSGDAESHFKNVKVIGKMSKRAWFDRGGGAIADPVTPKGVPYYWHDYYGPGKHARIVSIKAKDLLADGNEYKSEPPLTGKDARVTQVGKIAWPKLLEPVDDLPPATIITSVRKVGGKLLVQGVSHDNGEIVSVIVNGAKAKIVSANAGVVDWQIELAPAKTITAHATDRAGNVEKMAHQVTLDPAMAGQAGPGLGVGLLSK
jgi:hypothetical protein